MTVYIKDWFFNKMQAEARNIHLMYGAVEVVKETEKAYQVSVEFATLDGEYDGEKLMWCPKSCTMTADEYEKETESQKARFESGCKKYEEMIKFAKDNGVKGVRSGMRKETILAKINNAGLTYVA